MGQGLWGRRRPGTPPAVKDAKASRRSVHVFVTGSQSTGASGKGQGLRGKGQPGKLLLLLAQAGWGCRGSRLRGMNGEGG